MAARASTLLSQLTADSTLDAAYAWLCRQRREHSANSSVWDLRWRWSEVKAGLKNELRAETFRLGPTLTFVDDTGKRREMREARDALVIRALAQTLTPYLLPAIPSACSHVSGHGGAKGAIRQVMAAWPDYHFVFKTDVWRYYASIDQVLLMRQLGEIIREAPALRLIWQAVRRLTLENGQYREITRGIALGCPLSPLLGGLHLADVDRTMTDHRWCYVRFMDDLLVLCRCKRWSRTA